MFLARVFVTYKSTVSDPESLTIQGGLAALGFKSVTDVHAGKYIEIQLDEDKHGNARREITKMCNKLLANPIIEDYRFDLEEITN